MQKLIEKHKLSASERLEFISDKNVNLLNPKLTIHDQINNQNHFKSCISNLQRSKVENLSLERKINLLASNSNSSPMLYNKATPDLFNSIRKLDNEQAKNITASWKRLGAKSFHNLLVFSEFINYPTEILVDSNVQMQLDHDRASSGGVLLSSLSQQLHYEELKHFKSSLECAQMLSRKKKLFLKSKHYFKMVVMFVNFLLSLNGYPHLF